MTSAPVVPKPAATVVLIRDDPAPPLGRTPLQVFLQRRVVGMAFAGGMTVFPGGGVDPADHLDVAGWIGPGPSAWGERLGHPPELAAALVKAAVRETYEECGVLLAGDGPVALADPPTGPVGAPVPGSPMAEALLKPEALARLSDSDRELLTRLQAELAGGAPLPGGSYGSNGTGPNGSGAA